MGNLSVGLQLTPEPRSWPSRKTATSSHGTRAARADSSRLPRAGVWRRLFTRDPVEVIAWKVHSFSAQRHNAVGASAFSKPTSFVCFIESGLASVVAESSDGETVEVGNVGREGMTGYHVLQMKETSMHQTFMQSAGSLFFR